MTDVSSVSHDQLKSRRLGLRRRRRLHIGQTLWRFMALSGLTTAIFWGATRPIWLIQTPRQINVTGNTLLTDAVVQDLVPLDYPQSLFKVEPETIAQQLHQRGPMVSAEVTRQLLPPRLNVSVQERVPVALVLPASAVSTADTAEPATGNQYLQAGFIDAQGAWMPRSSFMVADSSPQLPTLRVKGLKPQYQRYWPQVYATVQNSPVKISEIDWQDPSNLVLHTDLGLVYLGPYTEALDQQLATLDKMRNLSDQVADTEVVHIDLTNPALPSISVVETSPTPDEQPAENTP